MQQTPAPNPSALPVTSQGLVRDDWIDYNGHMNVAYYVLAFDFGTDGLLDLLGLDADYRTRTAHSTFALEMHVTYSREIGRAEPYLITSRVLDADHKRIHMFHEMRHTRDGWLAASNEVITMHIDMQRRRSKAFPADVQARVDAMKAAHASLPRPPAAGSTIMIRH